MNQLIKKDSLTIISKGRSEEYTILGIFRAKQDFYPMKEFNKFLKDYPKNIKEGYFDKKQLLAVLEQKELVELIEYGEFYFGSDCEVDEVTYYS